MPTNEEPYYRDLVSEKKSQQSTPEALQPMSPKFEGVKVGFSVDDLAGMMGMQEPPTQVSFNPEVVPIDGGSVAKEDRDGCTYADSGRGDCDHFLGLPGKSIPGQHDGPDDTVDEYGKPNGWCWSCWKSYQIEVQRDQITVLKNAIAHPRDIDPKDDPSYGDYFESLIRLLSVNSYDSVSAAKEEIKSSMPPYWDDTFTQKHTEWLASEYGAVLSMLSGDLSFKKTLWAKNRLMEMASALRKKSFSEIWNKS